MAQNALMDFLQAASNAQASTVSAPVDALAWLMRKAGLPIPQAPVGGSDWMARQGLTAKPQNPLAAALGETAGVVAPMMMAAKAPQIAAGINQMQANALAPRQLNPQLGAIVWHGSPHKFAPTPRNPLGEFDAAHIGKGEGAQAYGHGLYFADEPTVAASYKATLSARVKDRLTIDGKVIDPDSMLGRAVEDVPRIGLQGALQKIDDNIRFNEKYAPDMAELYRSIRKQVESLDPSRVAVKNGQLYKVDLPDEAIARMLDWDKPLSQQAPEVQQLARRDDIRALHQMTNKGLDQATGAELYRNITSTLNLKKTGEVPSQMMQNNRLAGAIDASEALRQLGIPGIRYLDGASRGAGQGSRNYVVFPGEEQLLRILARE